MFVKVVAKTKIGVFLKFFDEPVNNTVIYFYVFILPQQFKGIYPIIGTYGKWDEYWSKPFHNLYFLVLFGFKCHNLCNKL